MPGIGVGVWLGSTRSVQVAMPWGTEDCIGYWGTPPYGDLTDDGGGLISQAYDMQPAWSYPSGKTGPFHLTSSGGDRPLLVDDYLYAADGQNDKLSSTSPDRWSMPHCSLFKKPPQWALWRFGQGKV